MEEEVMLTERTDSDYTSDTTPTPGKQKLILEWK